MEDFDALGVYDAVIVGTGLAGSTLAYRLGQRGLRVLVLERGDFLRPLTRKPDDPVGLSMASFRARGVSLPVGGKTKFYGAAMYRMRESDFRAVRHEAGESPAWPIAYSDLEPYYSEAEKLYRVHGASEGDPTEPPHSSGFPYPPIPHASLISGLIDNLRKSGTSVSSTPSALDYGHGGKCILCPTCDSYYCQLDAKMDAEIAALRPALTHFNIKLLTRATCLRILTSENGLKTTGVLIQLNGQQHMIHADTVVVCAGFLNSARLLIDSRCSRHPFGLGNSAGCVGRYYGGHTTGLIFPQLSMSRKLPPMHTKTFSINSYYQGTPDWQYPMGVIQAAGQIPFGEVSIDKFTSDRSICVFHMTEALPTRESGFEYHEGSIVAVTPPVENLVTFNRFRRLAIDVFRNAGYLVKSIDRRYLWHPTGTVRFGLDPNSSVLDANCKVHDLDNLYVVDASVLPSAGAVNTGLTISALALRVGDIIAGWS